MKQLLPILLCYVLMTSQVFAISGGPVYGGNGLNPVGTYSGVINVNQELDFANPVVDPVTGTLVPTVVADLNAIGLFSLGVPQTGVATGSFLLFVEGVVYTGSITASVNPDSGHLSGIVSGTTATSSAGGKITARIRGTRPGAISSASLIGTSNIDVNLDGALSRRLNCGVNGFRQSLTSSTTTITN